MTLTLSKPLPTPRLNRGPKFLSQKLFLLKRIYLLPLLFQRFLPLRVRSFRDGSLQQDQLLPK